MSGSLHRIGGIRPWAPVVYAYANEAVEAFRRHRLRDAQPHTCLAVQHAKYSERDAAE